MPQSQTRQEPCLGKFAVTRATAPSRAGPSLLTCDEIVLETVSRQVAEVVGGDAVAGCDSLETVGQEAPASIFRPKQTPLLGQQDEGHAETVPGGRVGLCLSAGLSQGGSWPSAPGAETSAAHGEVVEQASSRRLVLWPLQLWRRAQEGQGHLKGQCPHSPRCWLM